MWQSFSVTGYAFLQLIILSILARLVSPAEFGILAIANMVSGFAMLFAQMGMGPAVVQRQLVEERHTTTASTIAILLGLGCAVILWVIAPAVAVFFDAPESQNVLRAVGFSFLFNGLGAIPHALMQKQMCFKSLMQVQLSAYFFGYAVIAIPLALLGYGVWSLVIGILTTALINSLLAIIVSKWRVRFGVDASALKELLGYGGGATIMKVFSYSSYQVDYIVIGRLLGVELLGLYERAFSLMLLPGRYLGDVLDKVLFPAMSQIQDDKQRLSKVYLRGLELSNLLLFPVSVLMVIWANDIVGLFLGQQWSAVVFPFQLLAIGISLRIIGRMSESLIYSSGRVYTGSAIKLGYFLLVLLFSWFGARWGLPGVAGAVTFATFINFVAISGLSIRIVKTNVYDYLKKIWPGIFLGSIYLFFNLILHFVLNQTLAFLVLRLIVILFFNIGILLFIWRFKPHWLGEELLWLLSNLSELLPTTVHLILSKDLLRWSRR
jgi:O-antigen/teichoic acid export membrane protein